MRDATRWIALGLAGAFLLIAALFTLAPRRGALLFGIPAQHDDALFYVRAIGFRDLALAL
jgi:hypothetical protein